MARYYRRRRFGRRLRRAFKGKRSSLSRVKRDIMKCNFPTKVKFVGLTEKKVMFLTKEIELSLAGNTNNDKSATIVLDPLNTDNINSIGYNLDSDLDDGVPSRHWNWDKICILGIYIKFQPKKNMWSDDANGIAPVKCIYSTNIVPLNDSAHLAAYEIEQIGNKQVFTFNSNESFTMYVPAPTTMCSYDPCVHKSKTWWSLFNLVKHAENGNIKGENEIEDESMQDGNTIEDGIPILGATAGDSISGTTRPYLSAGRLFLNSKSAKYNVTINYKVALRG